MLERARHIDGGRGVGPVFGAEEGIVPDHSACPAEDQRRRVVGEDIVVHDRVGIAPAQPRRAGSDGVAGDAHAAARSRHLDPYRAGVHPVVRDGDVRASAKPDACRCRDPPVAHHIVEDRHAGSGRIDPPVVEPVSLDQCIMRGMPATQAPRSERRRRIDRESEAVVVDQFDAIIARLRDLARCIEKVDPFPRARALAMRGARHRDACAAAAVGRCLLPRPRRNRDFALLHLVVDDRGLDPVDRLDRGVRHMVGTDDDPHRIEVHDAFGAVGHDILLDRHIVALDRGAGFDVDCRLGRGAVLLRLTHADLADRVGAQDDVVAAHDRDALPSRPLEQAVLDRHPPRLVERRFADALRDIDAVAGAIGDVAVAHDDVAGVLDRHAVAEFVGLEVT